MTEVANDAEVAEVMSTFADAGIASEIDTVEKYEEFKTWVRGKNLYQPAVAANAHAAAAYQLGAERLFENEPTVEMGEVAMGRVEDDGQGGGALGITRPTMTVSVTVKDGERAVAVAAAKIAAMFKATGDLGDWNGAANMSPTVTMVAADGAMIRLKVTHGDGTAGMEFLRIRR